MINEPCVYPECCLPINTILFKFFVYDYVYLIIYDSIFNPVTVYPILLTYRVYLGFVFL